VPFPLLIPSRFEKQILACGAELKNTFCLTRDNFAFMSHHIGDLENAETLASFESGIEHFKRIFSIHPDVVTYDLHPDYLSTKYALGLPDLPKIGVQHHHAHAVSCMGDNGIEGEVAGYGVQNFWYAMKAVIKEPPTWNTRLYPAANRLSRSPGELQHPIYIRSSGIRCSDWESILCSALTNTSGPLSER
jgi:hypothetical protein